MRGKRQMLPVPTAIPSMASNMPQRELNTSDFDATGRPLFKDVRDRLRALLQRFDGRCRERVELL
jgi:hypothetical protein